MANNDVPVRRCATHDLSVADRARLGAMERGFRESTRIAEADLRATIPVVFIHVVDGSDGKVTQAQREKQIEVMNTAYSPIGITFSYKESEVAVVDNAAFFRMGHASARERQCKTQNQGIDPAKGLNFYTARPGGGLLGWATFPVEMEGDPAMDGVVILDTSLPDGTSAPYNLGLTAVHEVGHWLGLYHTFQDGCSPPGDEVADTPAHAGPNFGKPLDSGQPHNLCSNAPAGSLCPIHNYMNYVDDNWMNEFTAGQKERIWAQIGMFRSALLAAPSGTREAVMREAATTANVIW